jgi:16S rRNA (adenine1518-N6/adenine1519-N6)-dimethyltransferase
MSRIKSILTKHKIHAKKRLGQNFLIDEAALKSIVSCAGISKKDTVVEIGPGIGNLSVLLAEKAGKFYAVEKDKRLENVLRKSLKPYSYSRIFIADFLKFDISEIFKEKKIKIIGNLPYYITTPILNKLIENRRYIDIILVTVQKEVAQRITASPGKKDYGRLSCLAQFYTQAEIAEIFPKSMFFPKPEVDSALVKFKILDKPSIAVKSEKIFFQTVKAIFGQRRKTLLNSLANSGWPLNKSDISRVLDTLGIDNGIRGEKLSLSEIGRIADSISEIL